VEVFEPASTRGNLDPRSRSYFRSDGQSVSMSWCQAHPSSQVKLCAPTLSEVRSCFKTDSQSVSLSSISFEVMLPSACSFIVDGLTFSC
jgi:hypothetical protein